MDLVRIKIIWEHVMQLPKHIANPGLAALIQGAGFRSLERFAMAVNACGWETYGLKLFYDHVTVKRWLAGSVCQNPQPVAEVLSKAWGVPIPVQVLWPQLREGQGPVPAYLQAWVAGRTLEDLGAFIGADMLSRREMLAASVSAASGSTLVDPLTRWLNVAPVGLRTPADSARRIGMDEVLSIEAGTRHFAALDARAGGGLSREAAVGQLRYAVDLARYATYDEATGNRLLVAIAGLSGLAGWMSHDCGMAGPAQKYLLYGLQAARESADERAPLLVVRLLEDLGQQLRWAGKYDTAVRLFDLALGQLPAGRNRFNLTRALVTSSKAQALSYLGSTCLTEVRSAAGLAEDLSADASAEEREVLAGIAHRSSVDKAAPDLSAKAAEAHMVLAREDGRLAGEAETRALQALADVGEGHGRLRALALIRLARVRFGAGEPDQACDDGEQALEAAGLVKSAMIRARLRELLGDTEPYRDRPRVRELRERMRMALRS
jgi:tetratricopeptide (TPR) repeat protein